MNSSRDSYQANPLRMRTPIRVLVVDDNAVHRALAGYTLQGLGIEALFAADGAEAVKLFHGEVEVDLVLMDMQMPVMHGLTATKRIRQLESERSRVSPVRVPIVACSSEDLHADDASFQEAGLSGLLPKPYTTSAVIACLRRWCPDKVDHGWPPRIESA